MIDCINLICRDASKKDNTSVILLVFVSFNVTKCDIYLMKCSSIAIISHPSSFIHHISEEILRNLIYRIVETQTKNIGREDFFLWNIHTFICHVVLLGETQFYFGPQENVMGFFLSLFFSLFFRGSS